MSSDGTGNIRYALPEEVHVTLQIFNNGQQLTATSQLP